MSNADLYAERDRLQSELNYIVRENNALQAEIDSTVLQLNGIYNNLNKYQNDVNTALSISKNKLDSSEVVAENAFGLQQQIEGLYPLYKNMEEADKRIPFPETTIN